MMKQLALFTGLVKGNKPYKIKVSRVRTGDVKLDHIFEEARKVVRKKYPSRMDGETREEYNQFINDETKLEVADKLRQIAEKLEKQANERKQY